MNSNSDMNNEISMLMNRMPNTTEARKLRGYTAAKIAYEKYNNIMEAKKYLHMYLEERPKNIPALLLMGDIYFANKEYENALTSYIKIYDINESQEILLKICSVLNYLDNVNDYQDWINKTEKIYPKHEIVSMIKTKQFSKNYGDENSEEFYDTQFNFGSPASPKINPQIGSKFEKGSNQTLTDILSNAKQRTFLSGKCKIGDNDSSIYFSKSDLLDKHRSTPFNISSQAVFPNPIPGNIVINLMTGSSANDSSLMTARSKLTQDSETQSTLDVTDHADSYALKDTLIKKQLSFAKQDDGICDMLKLINNSHQSLLTNLFEQNEKIQKTNVQLANRIEDSTLISKSLFEMLNSIKDNQVSLKMEIENLKLSFSQLSIGGLPSYLPTLAPMYLQQQPQQYNYPNAATALNMGLLQQRNNNVCMGGPFHQQNTPFIANNCYPDQYGNTNLMTYNQTQYHVPYESYSNIDLYQGHSRYGPSSYPTNQNAHQGIFNITSEFNTEKPIKDHNIETNIVTSSSISISFGYFFTTLSKPSYSSSIMATGLFSPRSSNISNTANNFMINTEKNIPSSKSALTWPNTSGQGSEDIEESDTSTTPPSPQNHITTSPGIDKRDVNNEEAMANDTTNYQFKLPSIPKNGIVCPYCYVTNESSSKICIACESPIQVNTVSNITSPYKQGIMDEEKNVSSNFKIPPTFNFNFNLPAAAAATTSITTTSIPFKFVLPNSFTSTINTSKSSFTFDATKIPNVGLGDSFSFKSPSAMGRNDPNTLLNRSDSVPFDDYPCSPLNNSYSRKELPREEEGSEVLFAERAKLYRYDKGNKEWKVRGTGLLKILRPLKDFGGANTSDKHHHKKRIILRRDHVYKLACNHFVTPNTKLFPFGNGFEPNETTNKGITQYSWYACDFASPEIVECNIPDKLNGSPGPNIPIVTGINEYFTAKFKTPEIASEFKRVFELDSSSQGATDKVDKKLDLSQSSEDECTITFDNMPIANLVEKAKSLQMSPYFYADFNKSQSHDADPEQCLGCKDETTTKLDDMGHSAKLHPTNPATGSINNLSKVSIKEEFKIKSPTFSTLTTPPSTQFPIKTGTPQSPFQSAVSTVSATSSPDNKLIRVSEGVLVDQPTGDKILFNERAKLFRFNDSTKEWKERGLGQMLVLHHTDPSSSSPSYGKLLFRREQIFKLACNHRISPGIKLIHGPGGNDQNRKLTWTWRALDFADVEDYQNIKSSASGENTGGSEEKFTVRFKTQEVAKKFYDIVERAKNNDFKPLDSSEIVKMGDPSKTSPTPPEECYEENKPQEENAIPKLTTSSSEVSASFPIFGQNKLTSTFSSPFMSDFVPIKSDIFTLKSDLFKPDLKAILSSQPLTSFTSTTVNFKTTTDSCIFDSSKFNQLFASSNDKTPPKITNASIETPFTTGKLTNPMMLSSSKFTFSPAFHPKQLSFTSMAKTDTWTAPNTGPPIKLNLGTLAQVAEKNRGQSNIGKQPVSLNKTTISSFANSIPQLNFNLPKISLSNQQDSSKNITPIFGSIFSSSPCPVTSTVTTTNAQPSLIPKPGFFGSNIPVFNVTPSSALASANTLNNTPVFGASFMSSATNNGSLTSSLGVFGAALQNISTNVSSTGFTHGTDKGFLFKPITEMNSLFGSFNAGESQEIKPFSFDPSLKANKGGIFSNPDLFKPKPLFANASPSILKSGTLTQTQLDGAGSDVEDAGGDGTLLEEENTGGVIIDAPLVDLVPVLTGEEDLTVLFDQRVKLYRLVDKEWKEKGIGQFKILEFTSPEGRKKYRFLMRRDQIYKICCTHLITPDLDFKPFPNDAKNLSLTWRAVDHSPLDEVSVNTSLHDTSTFDLAGGRIEFFCIKFKNKDHLNEFMSLVNKIQRNAL